MTLYSQDTLILNSRIANDSIKCFTYSEARKIITDLKKLPKLYQIISVKDSTIQNLISIDSLRVDRIEDYTIEVKELTAQRNKSLKRLKRNRRFTFIIGGFAIIEGIILYLAN